MTLLRRLVLTIAELYEVLVTLGINYAFIKDTNRFSLLLAIYLAC